MRYFFDTEFIEGFKKPFKWLPTIGNFNKKYHSIQLISIGIVAEDGREYYAISNEFNANDASDWVKENIISKLPNKKLELFSSKKSMHETLLYKPNKLIAFDIINFVNPDLGFHCSTYNNSEFKNEETYISKHFKNHDVKDFDEYFYAQPEFYAYYADYDWVLFCSLFGTMMDLPKGFPMYCKDLKQTYDDASYRQAKKVGLNKENTDELSKLINLKGHKEYPKQINEHSAIDDAKWNKKLFEFIQKLEHNV